MTPPGPSSRPIDVCLSQVSLGSVDPEGAAGAARRGPGVTCACALPAIPIAAATIPTSTNRDMTGILPEHPLGRLTLAVRPISGLPHTDSRPDRAAPGG